MSNVLGDCLIIFTRYPEPGKVKTRLIPALGMVGAATLHQQMAEYTLEQARPLQLARSLAIEVWFTGGSIAQMQTWLGTDIEYQIQPEGDLGTRMAAAFKAMFCKGYTSVAIIGTDCPDLNTAAMKKCFDLLQQQDLVIGPALDGGYYLIGMRRLFSELFKGIAWSTPEVLKETLAIAQQLNIIPILLPYLRDIDVPKDLENRLPMTID